jgi:hypothetical protein
MTPLPIAHAGHWAIYVLYAVPVFIVLGSIARTMIRERKGSDGDQGSGGGVE